MQNPIYSLHIDIIKKIIKEIIEERLPMWALPNKSPESMLQIHWMFTKQHITYI